MRPRGALVLLVVAAALTGCGGGSSPRCAGPPGKSLAALVPDAFDPGGRQAPGAFVGAAEGDRDYVGFVVRGDRAIVYVCDGAAGDWLGANVRGGHINVRSARGTL